MIISDLNHVESVSESTSVVGGFDLENDYSNVQFYENFKLNKYISSNVFVYGHAATAESKASAVGPGTMTQTFNNAVTTPYSSSSSGASIAATSGFSCYCY
ncbi:MAG: hypothetical protein JGK17_05865 [Microcoleus sp. PH2017_10_PVI_O_A]|uniref:hypothetical protein n=1 Tax=unclassified Microcoleus TaxID=2642155 RepID=UPI001DA63AB9|nr:MULTISPECIES: hypothetical protein [unclassified Microcoleus]TAE84534.1 MAG: hypothetical protein EAZ83_06180 [Oscillatoriales cyanobacterium]MCC3405112.1 hypothetical protein [Microcoleus sp. PH2017_10_PVI_O_A]MCC3459195.1 hypothetical protein [Microcoleus sp. PH2017_11_PCY_U_A]MCC3477486.1 hypothetical protein [Microcoleus sp. PH2017_12_PCY_D_A]MCC3558582.1 hypothetical protein [Microcoleus sp. PH2017_27_LUM_O_A]